MSIAWVCPWPRPIKNKKQGKHFRIRCSSAWSRHALLTLRALPIEQGVSGEIESRDKGVSDDAFTGNPKRQRRGAATTVAAGVCFARHAQALSRGVGRLHGEAGRHLHASCPVPMSMAAPGCSVFAHAGQGHARFLTGDLAALPWTCLTSTINSSTAARNSSRLG
jgi:hypothetical protein